MMTESEVSVLMITNNPTYEKENAQALIDH